MFALNLFLHRNEVARSLTNGNHFFLVIETISRFTFCLNVEEKKRKRKQKEVLQKYFSSMLKHKYQSTSPSDTAKRVG